MGEETANSSLGLARPRRSSRRTLTPTPSDAPHQEGESTQRVASRRSSRVSIKSTTEDRKREEDHQASLDKLEGNSGSSAPSTPRSPEMARKASRGFLTVSQSPLPSELRELAKAKRRKIQEGDTVNGSRSTLASFVSSSGETVYEDAWDWSGEDGDLEENDEADNTFGPPTPRDAKESRPTSLPTETSPVAERKRVESHERRASLQLHALQTKRISSVNSSRSPAHLSTTAIPLRRYSGVPRATSPSAPRSFDAPRSPDLAIAQRAWHPKPLVLSSLTTPITSSASHSASIHSASSSRPRSPHEPRHSSRQRTSTSRTYNSGSTDEWRSMDFSRRRSASEDPSATTRSSIGTNDSSNMSTRLATESPDSSLGGHVWPDEDKRSYELDEVREESEKMERLRKISEKSHWDGVDADTEWEEQKEVKKVRRNTSRYDHLWDGTTPLNGDSDLDGRKDSSEDSAPIPLHIHHATHATRSPGLDSIEELGSPHDGRSPATVHSHQSNRSHKSMTSARSRASGPPPPIPTRSSSRRLSVPNVPAIPTSLKDFVQKGSFARHREEPRAASNGHVTKPRSATLPTKGLAIWPPPEGTKTLSAGRQLAYNDADTEPSFIESSPEPSPDVATFDEARSNRRLSPLPSSPQPSKFYSNPNPAARPFPSAPSRVNASPRSGDSNRRQKFEPRDPRPVLEGPDSFLEALMSSEPRPQSRASSARPASAASSYARSEEKISKPRRFSKGIFSGLRRGHSGTPSIASASSRASSRQSFTRSPALNESPVTDQGSFPHGQTWPRHHVMGDGIAEEDAWNASQHSFTSSDRSPVFMSPRPPSGSPVVGR